MNRLFAFTFVLMIGGSVPLAGAQTLMPAPVISGSEFRAAAAPHAAAQAGESASLSPSAPEAARHTDVLRDVPPLTMPVWTDFLPQQRIDRHIRSAA